MPAAPTTVAKPLTVELTMQADGKQLHVDYKVVNRTKASYWVEDVMIQPDGDKFTPLPTALIVHAGATASDVVFARGNVSPDSKVNIRYPPAVRLLEGGQTLTGSAVVPLPLKAWISYGQLNDLPGKPTQASLDIYVYGGTQPTTAITLADGTAAKTMAPTASAATILHSDAQPIPK